jgi:hydroxymethylbilane synthase
MTQLVIGSRGSKLAMTQSRWVADALRGFHPKLEVSIVEIQTSGDKNLGVSLSAFGGKGAFTKELEDAILSGKCDIAVHSLKDLPTALPKGLRVLCTPPREDTADLLILREAGDLQGLPKGGAGRNSPCCDQASRWSSSAATLTRA